VYIAADVQAALLKILGGITKKAAMRKNIPSYTLYEGYPESKERVAIKTYVLIIGNKTNMQVVAHTFTNFST
jgi:hypothetical protein